MHVTSLPSRRSAVRLAVAIGALLLLTATPAFAQGPGLPAGYNVQTIDSPSPFTSATFGIQTAPVGDVNGDGEMDIATNQTVRTPAGCNPTATPSTCNNEGQVWVYSGETGGLLGTFTAPDLGNPTNAAANDRALTDRWLDRLGDIGSCPANTAPGQTCASAAIGPPDGRDDFFVGAEGVDVGGVRDVGRVYVIDGATLSVLKRIDMPPGDRALVAARQAQFPQPHTVCNQPPGCTVRGGFGRTATTPRGLPVCSGNGGVVPCPSTTAIPPNVRIGDIDGGGQPEIVIGANRFTEVSQTAQPNSHCAQAPADTICFEAGRVYIYRGEEVALSNPAVNLDGSGANQTPPKVIRNLGAQSDANDTAFTRTEIFGHAQMPVGDIGACRVGGAQNFPAVTPGDRCSVPARTNVPDDKPDMIISAHRADGPILNPDPSRYEEGFSFLVDGATGAFLHVIHHPEPHPNALFGYTTRQSFPFGQLFGSALPDYVHAGWQNYAGKPAAGRLYLFNGDFNAPFPVIGTLDDPTPTTNERFGVAREGVGDLVPGNTGAEALIGNFPSNENFPDARTDMHFVNLLSGQELQRISDPDQQLASQFGYQVAPLGDLNEDGFLDFATAAPTWDSPAVGTTAGVTNVGRIYIFRSNNAPPPGGGGSAAPGRYVTPTPGGAATGSLAGCPSGRRLLSLTAANDTRNGTAGNDLILAGAGNDVIDALAGDDCVDLGLGTDRGQGGLGNDLVLGGGGSDRLLGNDGNDRLRGGAGVDTILGALGNDAIHGQSGNDRVTGSRGRDRINGGAGRDRLGGGSSADRISGDAGNDRISGNSGNDRIKGNSGNDRITGGAGRDRISCGRGTDTVIADRRDVVARDCERVRRR